MRLALKIAAAGLLLAAGWCALLSCTSLRGELAPTLTGGTLVMQGLAKSGLPTPQKDWRLFAFFSPG